LFYKKQNKKWSNKNAAHLDKMCTKPILDKVLL